MTFIAFIAAAAVGSVALAFGGAWLISRVIDNATSGRADA